MRIRMFPVVTTIFWTVIIGHIAGITLQANEPKAAVKSPLRFAKQIEAFARQDQKNPPKPGGVVFVGSSSIRRWDLQKSFPELNALNRGFGGSQISDVLHFANETVLKYKPRTLVFYCGSNDLANGKTPLRVFSDFRTFTKLLFEQSPNTRLILLAVKPSPRRVHILEKVRQTNDLIREAVKKDRRIVFLDDAFNLLMDGQGNIREELFVDDRVHLNEAGYQLWTKMLAPVLASDSDGQR